MKGLRRLWPFLAPDRRLFLFAVAAIPVVAWLGVQQPLLLREAVDTYVKAGDAEGVYRVAAWYLAAVLGAFLVEGAYTVSLAVAAENSIYRLRHAIFRHVLGLAQRFFERQPTGQVLTRATSDVEALSEALTAGSISILLDVVNMLAVLGTMFALDPSLTLVLLALGPPIAGLVEFFRRRMRYWFAEVRDALTALNSYTAERLAGVEVLQLASEEASAKARFRELDARHRDANIANNAYDASLYAVIDGVAGITTGLILAWASGALAGDAALVTTGIVVAFTELVDRLFRPLRELSGKITFLQRAGTALEKIFWLLDVQEHIGAGDQSPARFEGRLALRGVSFRYRPDGPDVLQDVNLEVAPGEVVAVVGRTGSGKSTLVRLLGRVHDGYRGHIEVDGVELSRIAPAAVRRAVGTVRQEVQLFTDTLRFNVTLGDPTLDPARVAEAVELSNASAVAARHPLGLDQPLRERGANVSAGEAQLIALARALARDPSVVILDEATASVDPVTERLLQEAIDRIFARKTCLVVAHRLSTIRRAHRIVVMDRGTIVEQGTHDELLALGGAYAALHAEGFGEPALAS